MMDLCFEHRGTGLDWHPMDVPGVATADADTSRVLMTVTLPLAEIVTDFFDKLKSRSSGFASFESVSSLSLRYHGCSALLTSSTVRFAWHIGGLLTAMRMQVMKRVTCER